MPEETYCHYCDMPCETELCISCMQELDEYWSMKEEYMLERAEEMYQSFKVSGGLY